MRIVLGVLAADGGEVRCAAGRSTARPARASATCRRSAALPEDAGARAARLPRAAARLAAAAAAARRPLLERLGLAERADDRVEALSLGNQQRAQLAAALVHGPELLVLDEPFSGLDPVAVDVLAGVLRGTRRRGVPVVFSSHQLELVERLCEAVAIISHGRLVASGRVDELASAARRRRPSGRGRVGGEAGSTRPGRRGADRGPRRRAGGGAARRRRPDQALLDAARAAGRVSAFGLVRPTLADLFREVVET